MIEKRKCVQCGATLSIYNQKDKCQSHSLPKNQDEIGDKIRLADKLLRAGLFSRSFPKVQFLTSSGKRLNLI